ncbi:hypothetical protein C8Q75DRAFT_345992 [Abortiporus biennis]|nr:hypothetical protein C8Q75DRAFT_345992 [Abortiporus biennis]
MHAALTDFGLAVYVDGLPEQQHSFRAGNDYFLPLERQGDLARSVRQTKEGDVFSFACVCLQMFAGRDHPYYVLWTSDQEQAHILKTQRPSHRKVNKWYPLQSPYVVETLKTDGHPPRPVFFGTEEQMGDGLWNILRPCFEEKPENRPTIEKVFEQLKSHYGTQACDCTPCDNNADCPRIKKS